MNIQYLLKSFTQRRKSLTIERIWHLLHAATATYHDNETPTQLASSIKEVHLKASRVLAPGRNQYFLTNSNGQATVEDWVIDRFSNKWESHIFENYGLQNLHEHLVFAPSLRDQYSRAFGQRDFSYLDQVDINHLPYIYQHLSTYSPSRLGKLIKEGGKRLHTTRDQRFSNAPNRTYWNKVLSKFINWVSFEELLMLLSWPIHEGQSGFPDLVAHDGQKVFFLEVKADGDRLRPTQAKCINFISEVVGIPCMVVYVSDSNSTDDEYQRYFNELRTSKRRDTKALREFYSDVCALFNINNEVERPSLSHIRFELRRLSLPEVYKFPVHLTEDAILELASRAHPFGEEIVLRLEGLAPEAARRQRQRLEEIALKEQERIRLERELAARKERERPFVDPYERGKALELKENDREGALQHYEQCLSQFEANLGTTDASLFWLLASLANRYSICLKALERYNAAINVINRADKLLPTDFSSTKWQATLKRRDWLLERL
ncbi:VRR-NUC domain-containing protein [Lujinxingia vulgaris]|uniref:VRR-NUC domain-containing protein n=1 Tax=Lujinxingia vulgaris TaxID=2600176 RepID=A0A5C6XBL2_9DELT|nr:VRR-NUC domain-containing protein [Lujinxingia vulgaris]TXD34525.1 VRR-NUC domain-containing protein [Lujinxingia vulgaris]